MISNVDTRQLTRVRVKDLPLLADVGVNPDEIGRRQPLVVTAEVTLAADAVTDLRETIDYRTIVEVAEKLAQEHIPLIETFAQLLCKRCLVMAGVVTARVSVDKPFAITRGLAGVEVEMSNRNHD
jgi:dihydroneopterin aldolase